MRWPLLDLLRAPRARLDLATVLVLTAIGAGVVGTVGAALAPQAWLERGHLVHGVGWFLVTQPIPYMYTAENHVRIDYLDEPDPGFEARCASWTTAVRNHVPLGALVAIKQRPAYALCGERAVITLESTLRGHTVTTRWRTERRGRGYAVRAAP